MTTPADGGRCRLGRLLDAVRFELIPLDGIDDALAALPPGSPVSVTCSPVRGIGATMALTDRLRTLGHHPVPHLSARLVEGPAEVARLAGWLRTEAVGHAFVIGGDAPTPRGPYRDAASFLVALLDAGPGLVTVGVAAYPDGHPSVPDDRLDAALDAKQTLLAAAGVLGYATTQLCFQPDVILRWLTERRHRGLILPVHLGIAGSVDPAQLLRTGARLGVGASLRYLCKNTSAVGRLLTQRYEPGHDRRAAGW
ncbi:MAG: methylenetetrahydrofolate reductase [Acidimicrobiales bacterium]